MQTGQTRGPSTRIISATLTSLCLHSPDRSQVISVADRILLLDFAPLALVVADRLA